MNNLSWMLYAADVLNQFNIVAFLAGLALTAGQSVAIGGIRWAAWLEAKDLDEKGSHKPPEWRTGLLKIGVVLIALSCLIPSSKTVYMIAASETAERVATTPQAREMLDLIRRRLAEALSDKA